MDSSHSFRHDTLNGGGTQKNRASLLMSPAVGGMELGPIGGRTSSEEAYLQSDGLTFLDELPSFIKGAENWSFLPG
jgi:hypothetical protein